MCNTYDDFLDRLERYRLSWKMTQEEVGAKINITQSQISKMELGKTIFPNKVLRKLKNIGWDIDYLLIGKESVEPDPVIAKLLEHTRGAKRHALLQILYWILKQETKKQEMDYEIESEIGILHFEKEGGSEKTILYEVRQLRNLSQISMAEQLGVNIKKYRLLERGKIYPDAELMIQLYKITGCRPSLFLEGEHFEEMIVYDLWDLVDPKRKEKIISFLGHVEEFLK